jgi:large subunit ribosomal protein L4
MATVTLYNIEGKSVGKIDVDDSIFAAEVNTHLMHMAVVNQLANKRQGTQSAKVRSEVRGGGRKPWKQKGTGHARQGSTRAPQWKGGGMVFAVKPRDYDMKMNVQEKGAALRSALTTRVSENKMFVLDSLELDEAKTKKMQAVIDALKVNKALVVLANDEAKAESNSKAITAAKNIPDVRTVYSNAINVYDILKYENLVITQDAVKKIEEVYA